MKTNLLNAKHHMKMGPGGWFCTCCGPAPQVRKAFARKHKKKMYRMLDRQINKDFNDAN